MVAGLPDSVQAGAAGAGSTRGGAAGAERLLVAMSGGVDSSVTAWMLAQAGHPLVGVFMRNGVKLAAADEGKKSCCSVHDARDARMVAAELGIPFQAVDLAQEFREIIRYFTAQYASGHTPNPCAVCNRDLKFGKLLELADQLGAAGVATGHYARIARVDGRVVLRRGLDAGKDQSYQLFAVPEAQLARTHLPLGELSKREVRAMAERAGLRTAAKRDSQEICFVPGNDYRQLLDEQGVALHPGRIVDSSGRELGRHAGTEHFTIGQRRGHGVAGGAPLYVIALEPESGTVVLGTREECCRTRLATGAPNWIGFDPPAAGEFRAEVQLRYHHRAAPATVRLSASRAEVEFDEPQSAIAPGQAAAFYLGDRLIGGGWIEREPRAAAAPEARAHAR